MDEKLYEAVTVGNLNALTELIGEGHKEVASGGVNIHQQLTPGKNTSLHLAAYYGHLEIVQRLLKLITDPITDDIESGNEGSRQFIVAKNLQGNTALHEAAKGGHSQVVDVLLEHRADMANIVNKAGETALFKAAEEGHLEIVKKLVPLTSPDYDRRTAGDGHTPLHAAVSRGDKDVIEYLLDQRPDLLKKADNFDRTPLHTVAYVENASEIAKLLLGKDTSLCYKVDKKHGQSALHLAVIEGNVDLVKEILNYGRDCLEIVDEDGRNALHLAAENAVQIFEKVSRRIRTLVSLIISKQLINDLDKHGKTPLDIVLEKMSSDERLYSGMKRLLKTNGAWRNPKMVDEETLDGSSAAEQSVGKNQMISVNAVLIATVAFQAAFTLPEEASNAKWFVAFVLCDALAFCSAIATAVVLIYANYGNQEDSLLVKTSVKGLWIALVALVAAFAVAIYIKVELKHRLVAEIVRMMAVGVPIAIFVMILRSKNYIFSKHEAYARVCVIVALLTMLLFIPFIGELMSAIWTTLAFVVFLVAVKLSTKPISKDYGLWRWGKNFNSVWGKIFYSVCIVIILVIVALVWIMFALETWVW